MANLTLQATVELIDKMTAPMRSIASQGDRLSRQFGEMARESGRLAGQQRLIQSFYAQRDALNDTSESVVRNRQRLQQLQQQMQATANPSATLVRQFESAQRESERLNTRLTSQRQHLQQLRGRLNEAGISTSNLADHERDLARQIERTNTQLGQQRERMQAVRRLQRQANQTADMRNKAAGLAMGGAAATYAGARFVQPGLELEQNMSKVQAVTRLDKNSEQYKALEAQAKHLGASTQFTSADAAQGQKFLAMAGFTPDAIQAAMPGMLDLALAGDIDLPRTADIASNILSGMKLDPTKDMGTVGDVLSAAFTRANLNVEMLGETMKYAAPGAANLNVSIEELAAMAGKLGDAGMQGSMGGTALRSIMTRLADPPEKAAAALKKLNIATSDANGNLRSMPDILDELHEKTQGLGNTEKTSIFASIAGLEASNALSELVARAGSGELQKLISDLQNSDGELKNLSQTMSDNTTGDFKAMQSAVDALRTSIFDANKDAIRGFIQSLTELTGKFTTFANAHPQLMAVLGKLFAILAIGAVILGSIGAVMLTILGPMALLRASLITLGLPTTLTPLTMLAKGIGIIGTVIRAVGIAMMANPILALLALLATLALVIYTNWSTLGPMFASLWNRIATGASALWQRLIAIWGNIKMSVIAYANQLWSGLGIRFNSGIAALIGIILAFSPVGLFVRAFAAVWAYFAGLGARFRQYGGQMIDGLKQGILGKAQAVIGAISSIAARIKGAFTSARGMDIHSPSRVFARYGGYMMQGLSGGVAKNANLAINAVKGVAGRIQDHAPMSFDTRKSILPTGTSAYASGGGMAGSGGITININGATDPAQVAREVERVLSARERASNARHRSRLMDID